MCGGVQTSVQTTSEIDTLLHRRTRRDRPDRTADRPRRHPDRIYIDHGFSGTSRKNRAGLDQALAAVWDGSIFTVTKFDRFARNMTEACQILTDLSERGVRFGLGPSIHDWNDPFGQLFLQTLAMVAEFEANLIRLRTREGMAVANAKANSAASNPSCPSLLNAPSAPATPKATYPWPTSPRNTASAAPPSTASSTATRQPAASKRRSPEISQMPSDQPYR
jgi:hypothetical protein